MIFCKQFRLVGSLEPGKPHLSEERNVEGRQLSTFSTDLSLRAISPTTAGILQVHRAWLPKAGHKQPQVDVQLLFVRTHRLLPPNGAKEPQILFSSFATFLSCSSSALTISHACSPLEIMTNYLFSRWPFQAPPALLFLFLCQSIVGVRGRVMGVHQRLPLPHVLHIALA